jgi:hypothetical protein
VVKQSLVNSAMRIDVQLRLAAHELVISAGGCYGKNFVVNQTRALVFNSMSELMRILPSQAKMRR